MREKDKMCVVLQTLIMALAEQGIYVSRLEITVEGKTYVAVEVGVGT